MCLCRSLLFPLKGNPDETNTKGPSVVPGWKLFGKLPPKLAPEKEPSNISLEYKQTRRLDPGKPEPDSSMKLMTNSLRGQVARRSDTEVPSTTALILEHRPGLVLLLLLLLLLKMKRLECYTASPAMPSEIVLVVVITVIFISHTTVMLDKSCIMQEKKIILLKKVQTEKDRSE